MNERYIRQTMIPEIGEAGQEKLKNAKVLIVGIGGLGSPISLYLTAAGVGQIGLIDDDIVSKSNLQRQILYTEANRTIESRVRLSKTVGFEQFNSIRDLS